MRSTTTSLFKKVLHRRTFKIGATVAFLFIGTIYLKSFAFTGPTGPGGTGSGAIGSDNNNNVSFGTSTTSNTTKLLIVASSTNSGEYALRIVQPNGSPVLIVRNDGNIGIGTSTPGSALTVNGTIFSTSPFTGTISAPNVSSGQFGGSTGGGNFSFPASLGVGASPSANYKFEVPNVGAGYGAKIGYVDIARSGSDYDSIGYNFRSTGSSGVYNYDIADTSSRLEFTNGGFRFKTAASGVAGNAITYANTVEIPQSGGGGIIAYDNAGAGDVRGFEQILSGAGRYQVRLHSVDQVGTLDLYNGNNTIWTHLSGNGTSYFNGGNVGIGTTGPNYKLEVRSTVAGQTAFIRSDATTGTNYGADIEAMGAGATTNIGGYFAASGATNNYAIIVPSGFGSVGIGTASPGQKLSVVGTIESTSGGFKFPDGTTQTTAASGGSTINATNVSAGTFGANTGGGTYYFSGGIGRTAHSSGFLLGSYNNVGGNDTKTNPIYAIGSSYVPTDTSLSNMYGIGYSHSNFWGAGKSSGWGLYVTSAGTVYDTISDGGIWTAGSFVTGTTIRAGTYMYTPTLALNDQTTLSADGSGVYLGVRGVNNNSGGVHVFRNDGSSWGYFYADGSGIGILNGASGWAIRSSGAVNAANADVSFFTDNVQRAYINSSGLFFTGSNPYISASSYFVAPGGAYFNSGTVYTEAQIKARGGIGTDTNAYLTLAGGTSGITYFSGNVGIGTTSPGYPLDVEGRIRAHNGEVIASIGNSTRALLSTSGAHGIVWLYDINDIKQVSISAGANSYFDGGNVGIGTPVPNYPLTVVASKAAGGNVMFQNTSADGWSGFDMYNYAGSLKATIGYDNTNSDLMINSWYDRLRLQAGGAQVALLTNGNFGIGTTAPNYQLELTTDSAAKPNGGSWTNPSDIRLKENVRPFTDGLATLMNVTPKQWEYNGKGGSVAGSHGIGFVAQDVKDILPYAVGTFQMKLNPSDAMATTLYNFNPSSLDFIEINAIKELNTKVDAQQKEINELKAEIQVLEGK